MSDSAESTQQVLEWMRGKVEPEPSGDTNAFSPVWTSRTRLKAESKKPKTPFSRDEAENALEELVDDGRVLSWHGLLAPADDGHLEAVLENESMLEGGGRRLLIAKANRLRSDGGEQVAE